MKLLTRQKTLFALIATIVLSLLLGAMFQRQWFLTWHLRATNLLYTADENKTLDDIVIVAIDNKSLERRNSSEIGTLRFDKADYAQVLVNLEDAGARSIAVDVIFSEMSSASDQKALSDVLKKYDNIIIAAEADQDDTRGLKPLPAFLDARPENVASIVLSPDMDNTVRREHVFFADKQASFAFDLEVVKRYLGLLPEDSEHLPDEYRLMPFASRVGQKKYEAISIPLDESGAFLINYFGPPYSFQTISFSDAYDGQMVHRDSGQEIDLKDKIVLIGEMGTGIHDQQYVPTSYGTPMPGVEIHAHAIQTILTQRFLQEYPDDWMMPTLLIALAIAFALFLFLPISYSIAVFVLAELGYLIAALVAFSSGWILNMVYPFLAILLAFVTAYVFRYFLELKTKKKTEKAFSRYVSENLVKKILENPDKLKLGGEKKELTVFFSDIVAFTSISEQLKPEQLVDQLNEYLELMSETILLSEGTVDKFIGDSIMAFWGAPLPQADHAVRACLTALEYQARLDELNARWKKAGKLPFPARIGINTGDLIVGNIGSSKRFDYTVIGDTVNLSSRLEGANTNYKTGILISESTYKEAKDHIEAREVDMIRVKGKKKPVRIFELMARADHLSEKQSVLLEYFSAGLKSYRAQSWNQAEASFKKALNIIPEDGPSACFVQRCQEMSSIKLPKDWDGVYVMTSK